jgi:hypothetical protein
LHGLHGQGELIQCLVRAEGATDGRKLKFHIENGFRGGESTGKAGE